MKKGKLLVLTGLAAVLLAGCATQQASNNTTPTQSAYAAQANHNSAIPQDWQWDSVWALSPPIDP